MFFLAVLKLSIVVYEVDRCTLFLNNDDLRVKHTMIQQGLKLSGSQQFFIALSVLLGFAIFVEYRAWQIEAANLSDTGVFNMTFLTGALRTWVASMALGAISILFGMTIPASRAWAKRNWVVIGFVGAMPFLIAMLALIAWAP